MKTILFPTNFSGTSKKAIQNFLSFFLKNGNRETRFILFNAYKRPHIGQSMLNNISDILAEYSMEDLKREAQEIKMHLGDYKIDFELVSRKGFFYEVLQEFTEEVHVDLMVMGMKSSNVFRDYVMGNYVLTAVHQINIPTLLLPETDDVFLPRHIVYATDYQDINNIRDFKKITNVVNALGAKFTFLNIKEKESKEIFTLSHEIREVLADTNFEVDVVENDHLVKGIVHYIEDKRIDVLALNEHRESFLNRYFQVDLSSQFVKLAKFPLLIIHEGD